MKTTTESRINSVIVTTGIASVVTQLLTIREFLAQFSGNEFVIAIIFFNWLVLGGLGTKLAHLPGGRSLLRPTVPGLAWLSILAAVLPLAHILSIRLIRDLVFIPGSAVGFYSVFAYTCLTTAPYCMLIGFLLPYSLLVLRNRTPAYAGARVYITDNIGDICGGVLFSFAMVHFLTPLQAVFFGSLPLVACTALLFRDQHHAGNGNRKRIFLNRKTRSLVIPAIALGIIAAGMALEEPSLALRHPSLVHYKESRYGRITVEKDNHQHTLRMDGMPVASTDNIRSAEEAAHYPLSQISEPQRILLISARTGILQEIQKHRPTAIDYVEIDPHITETMFRYGLLRKHPNVTVINADARAFLMQSARAYDAVIACLPEPDTFQLNRFYTASFFALVHAHLTPDGVFSFSMAGVENYLSATERDKLSSVYNTASIRFSHVKMIPGGNTIFLCSSRPLTTDILKQLEKKGVSTQYIKRFYAGDVTTDRIQRLVSAIDPKAPENLDIYPALMRRMFADWFTTFDTSPRLFYLFVGGFLLVYVLRIQKGAFVLFTTGFSNMGAELLTIFAFQVFFGYIYYQVGLIVTVFLAGLLPGAWLGERSKMNPRRAILLLDTGLIILMGLTIPAVCMGGSQLPEAAYLIFGFLVSFLCGCQFPMILHWRGDSGKQAVEAFSADLIGAAFGALVVSTLLIPNIGLTGAAGVLVALKIMSMISVGVR